MKLTSLTRRTVLAAATAALAATMVATPALADTPRMGVVVKIGGIPWFNAMEVGIKARAEELGWDAWMVGPTSADPALQVRAVEDLIAQGVDAIGVVPNDAEVLEPVLARAREQGILVITHESPDQKNVDWNFELASSTGFGEAHAKMLADKMGGEGKYAVYVGSLNRAPPQRVGGRGHRLARGEPSRHGQGGGPLRGRGERGRLPVDRPRI